MIDEELEDGLYAQVFQGWAAKMRLEEGLYAMVFQGWTSPEYILLDEWVDGCEGAVWDYNAGRSYINGATYYCRIFFDTKEDMLVCKLRFPDLVKLYNV